MVSNCINYDCPIVKQYGQICLTQYPKNKPLDNVERIHPLTKNKPTKGENGRYTCYQFGD
jgi:hypothetical protein